MLGAFQDAAINAALWAKFADGLLLRVGAVSTPGANQAPALNKELAIADALYVQRQFDFRFSGVHK